jgi:hypothetical protein
MSDPEMKDPTPTPPDVSPERSAFETDRSNFTSMITWAISGIVLGINLGAYTLAARPKWITSATVIALVLLQFAILGKQFFQLRRWRRDLRAERQRMMERYNRQIDEMFADDPIAGARIKMSIERQWPRP